VAGVEALETRQMLSAAIDHRVLVIEGTRRSDVIEVAAEGRKSVRVTVNGRSSTFAFRQFGRIAIVAGKGNDLIAVGSLERAVRSGASVDCGEGNDTVVTGDGNDSITGGAGDDSLSGRGGADTIRGGGGNDQVFGGADGDALLGDDGADTVNAGTGDDRAWGGAGDDWLYDGAGADRVWGGSGDDVYEVTENRKEFKDRSPAEHTLRDAGLIELAVGHNPKLQAVLLFDHTRDGRIELADWRRPLVWQPIQPPPIQLMNVTIPHLPEYTVEGWKHAAGSTGYESITGSGIYEGSGYPSGGLIGTTGLFIRTGPAGWTTPGSPAPDPVDLVPAGDATPPVFHLDPMPAAGLGPAVTIESPA
jgi:hypothetical protein